MSRDEEIIEIMAAHLGLGESGSKHAARKCYHALREAGLAVVPEESVSDAQVDAFFDALKRRPPFGMVTRSKVRAGYRAMVAAHSDTAPDGEGCRE